MIRPHKGATVWVHEICAKDQEVDDEEEDEQADEETDQDESSDNSDEEQDDENDDSDEQQDEIDENDWIEHADADMKGRGDVHDIPRGNLSIEDLQQMVIENDWSSFTLSPWGTVYFKKFDFKICSDMLSPT